MIGIHKEGIGAMKRKLGINIDCQSGMLDETSTLKLASEIGYEVLTTGSGETSAMLALK